MCSNVFLRWPIHDAISLRFWWCGSLSPQLPGRAFHLPRAISPAGVGTEILNLKACVISIARDITHQQFSHPSLKIPQPKSIKSRPLVSLRLILVFLFIFIFLSVKLFRTIRPSKMSKLTATSSIKVLPHFGRAD